MIGMFFVSNKTLGSIFSSKSKTEIRKSFFKPYNPKNPQKTIGVHRIFCYNCKDVFVENEERCDKCGAPRPQCVICSQNLSPEKDSMEEVIVTPCCSVYVHKKHFQDWLKVSNFCPNCKNNLLNYDLRNL